MYNSANWAAGKVQKDSFFLSSSGIEPTTYRNLPKIKLGWESTERFFFSELVRNRTYDSCPVQAVLSRSNNISDKAAVLYSSFFLSSSGIDPATLHPQFDLNYRELSDFPTAFKFYM